MKRVLFTALGILAWMTSHLGSAQDTATSDQPLRSDALSELGLLPLGSSIPSPEAELGRALFWDPRLSADGRTACASCHRAADGGADRRPFSTDARGRSTSRNSQTVFNAMLQPALRWTGDRHSGAHQAERSLTGSMGFTNAAEVLPLLRSHGYEASFRRAWPADPQPITVTHYAQALEAYQTTLVTPGPFDRFLAGDPASLTPQQKKGLRVFLTVGCADCHGGRVLGGQGIRKFGLKRPYWEATKSPKRDTGVHESTRRDEDRDLFRVPMLRNVAKTGPYFHDGSVVTLLEAVQVMADVQLGRRLDHPDAADLVAFLEALTGEVPDHFRNP
jgi:cytochrome c peroxidase